MSSNKNRVAVLGSDRVVLSGARLTGAANPQERVEVTVIVRPGLSNQAVPSAESIGAQAPDERSYLTREEFETSHGASPEDIAKVESFARQQGLDVKEENLARRSLVLSGTVAQLSSAFGVQLANYQHPDGAYRGRTGPIYIPQELSAIIQAVLGLDDRPQAKPHFRSHTHRHGDASYTPPQLAKLYNFPPGLNGEGECIGILELGGGSRAEDLGAYFAALGIPLPTILSVSVDGGKNNPVGDPSSADGEVMLDIEVAGSLAPNAKIAVYFAPNTDRGFIDALTTAVHDAQNKPSVISISWGAAENKWTHQAIQAFNGAFQEAAVLGVTICCASGDSGSSDGEADGLAHVDFPASSPYVLSCGGTRLESKGGKATSEVVWNDKLGASGGGVSDVFSVPDWQTGASVPSSANPPRTHKGRGVPDVCGDADPATGYVVRVDGQELVFGGTSAVAPLWAALIALVNQKLVHPVGFLNPLLYRILGPAGVLRDVSVGSNGSYQARKGWDPCTGLGSPDGVQLLSKLAPKVLTEVTA